MPSGASEGFPYEYPVGWDDFQGQTCNFLFQPTKSFKADALLLRKDIVKSFAADAIICPPFFDKSFQADALLSIADIDKPFLCDAMLSRKDIEAVFSADAILYQAFTWDELLLQWQQKNTYTAYVKLELTDDVRPDYTFTNFDYLIEVEKHHQDPFKENATVILKNRRKYLSDKALKGYTAVLYFGIFIGGVAHSVKMPPMSVIDQIYDSTPGVLTCTLQMKGLASKLDDDKANCDYEGTSGLNVKGLLEGVIEATLQPFNHCLAYEVVFHQTDATLNHVPGENFVIYLNATRLDVIRYLLDRTNLFMRVENDGKIHIFKPVITGADYDYEYSLDGVHTFFTKKDIKRIVIPNHVVVKSYEEDEWGNPLYTGTAQDNESVEDYDVGIVKYFEKLNVQSDSEAGAMASAILGNIKANTKWAEAVVPMNCFAQCYDYVKITDKREGTTAIGNCGYLNRYYKAGKYRMEIGFGGWLNARSREKFLKPYTGKRPDVETTYDLLPGTFSATRLAPNEYMTFLDILMPTYHYLYIKSWSVYADAGQAQLDILYWTGTWNSVGNGFPKSSNGWEKLTTPMGVLANWSGADMPVKFLVRNAKTLPEEDDAEFVTGHITYDIRGIQ